MLGTPRASGPPPTRPTWNLITSDGVQVGTILGCSRVGSKECSSVRTQTGGGGEGGRAGDSSTVLFCHEITESRKTDTVTWSELQFSRKT